MTKLCNSCEYLRYCARSGIEDVGCDRYKQDTTTNEEWFCGLSTEEKARFFADNDGTIQIEDEIDYKNTVTRWEKWLKEKHHG